MLRVSYFLRVPLSREWALLLLLSGVVLTLGLVLSLALAYPTSPMIDVTGVVLAAGILALACLWGWVMLGLGENRSLVLIPLSLGVVLFYILSVFNLAEEFFLLSTDTAERVKESLVFCGAVSLLIGLIISQWEVRRLGVEGVRTQGEILALREFTAVANIITDLQGMVSTLVRVVRTAVHAERVWLLLPDPEGKEFVGPEGAQASLTLRSASPVVQRLERTGACLQVADLEGQALLGSSSSMEQQELRAVDTALLAPVMVHGRLSGVLVLGPKLFGAPYTVDDMRLLSTVGLEAGMALENARLYAQEQVRAAQLLELDQLKTEFLGTVSHQLKTPITSIKAALGLLKDELGGSPQSAYTRLLDNANRGAESLEKLVNDLLDFARLRSARVHLDPEITDLRDVVREAEEIIGPSVEAKGQLLEVLVPQEPLQLTVDRGRLLQVLLNLLSNANRYTSQGGHITVQARQTDSQVVVSVQDTCEGISPEEQNWIFDGYRRPRSEGSAVETSGSGLGLAIARSLVELHSGSIWVESRLGEGCTFSFSLPVPQGADEGPSQDSG